MRVGLDVVHCAIEVRGGIGRRRLREQVAVVGAAAVVEDGDLPLELLHGAVDREADDGNAQVRPHPFFFVPQGFQEPC